MNRSNTDLDAMYRMENIAAIVIVLAFFYVVVNCLRAGVAHELVTAQPHAPLPPRLAVIAPARLSVPETFELIDDDELMTPGKFAADHRKAVAQDGGSR